MEIGVMMLDQSNVNETSWTDNSVIYVSIIP